MARAKFSNTAQWSVASEDCASTRAPWLGREDRRRGGRSGIADPIPIVLLLVERFFLHLPGDAGSCAPDDSGATAISPHSLN
jgi:hypothetical protein